MNILKRKSFERWQAGEKLPDAAVCKAAKEMEEGLGPNRQPLCIPARIP